MSVNLSPLGGVGAQFFNNNGVVLSGGKIYTYLAGTSTPATTYTTVQANIAHANPIVLDSAGRVPGGEIWLTDGVLYKFILKDANDALIATYDNINGIGSVLDFEEVQVATAGQTVFTLTNTYTVGTNALQVFVDGVNQYDGAQYSYVETNSNTVTFSQGLHVGALVKFTGPANLASGSLVVPLPVNPQVISPTVQLSMLAGAAAQFFDNNGSVLSGGLIYTYDAGTTTPKATYTTGAGDIAHTNPIVLDASGRVPGGEIWLADAQNYKFVVKTSAGIQVGSYDNITGNASGILSSLAASSGSSLIGFIAAGTGAVAETVQSKLRQTVSVMDFGAVGDGVADDTAAIQAAIDAALVNNQRVVAYGTFKISSKIIIKGDTDFSQATFNVYGTPAIALEVSTGNASNPTTILKNAVVWLPKRIENMTKPATGWAGQGVGVRTVNTYSCSIFVGNIVNFSTNLLVTSFGTGNVYNNYYLGHLENGQVNLALTPGDATAYTNENNFFGGRYSQYSAEGTNVSGVRHILISKATSTVNNNLFTKPSIEGNTPEYQVENGGSANTIIQGRWESSPPKVLYTADNSSQANDNIIAGGYNVFSIQFTYTVTGGGNNNKVQWGRNNNYDTGGSSTGIYKYMNGASSDSPIHTFYEASNAYRPELAGATDWAMRHSAQSLLGKRRTDTYERLSLDYVNAVIGLGSGAASPDRGLAIVGTSALVLTAPLGGVVRTSTDNSTSLGNGTYRWSVVYAGTGTINTSDEREKQDIADLEAAEKRVAIKLKGLVKKFRFKDAVAAKGDKARIHVGVVAQDVMAAFQAEGLDPMQYAIVCYDEWEATEDQPAGNRYGIRYDELLAFIIGAI